MQPVEDLLDGVRREISLAGPDVDAEKRGESVPVVVESPVGCRDAEEGDVLITIQAHNNTVAVASHVESPAIIICNDRPIAEGMIEAAQEHDIAIFRTSLNQFEVSGRLHALLE